MDVIYSHAWMQKHPTPTNQGGDFHWHPANVPHAIRATLTELATRSRGHTASAWVIDDSYVAWARMFSAVSPSDRRRYTGLSATIARAPSVARNSWSQLLPGVFGNLPVHPVAPFAGQTASSQRSVTTESRDVRPDPVDPDSLVELFDASRDDVAGAVYLGGQAYCRAPLHDALPGCFGRLLTWLPLAERHTPRTGLFTDNRAAVDTREHDRAMENLLHYLSAAWSCPASIRRVHPDYPRDAWQLVRELSAASSDSLAHVFGKLTQVAASWDSAQNLWQHLVRTGVLSESDIKACDRQAPSPLCAPSVRDAGWLWNRVLHYWGRGFLADSLHIRLAELLAQRIAADHLFHLDAPSQRSLPRRYLRRLHYEALLTRERTATMNQALTRYLPSLSTLDEVHCG